MVAFSQRHINKGFTVVELMVVVIIFGVLGLIAFPQFVRINGQMKASEDARVVAHTLGEIRAEAIRLRSNVRVTFTSTGLTWDIDDDGDVDGNLAMNSGTEWSGSTPPAAILFNGLGLVRGLGSGIQQMRLENTGYALNITINSNGHIDL